jgi:hypothetical protein
MGANPRKWVPTRQALLARRMAALNSLNFESMIRVSYFGGGETNELITIWILARTVARYRDIGAVATFGMHNCRHTGSVGRLLALEVRVSPAATSPTTTSG